MPPDETTLANLPSRPQEFVKAILQEIEASKKGETRVRLTRGRRIAQIGRQFHYSFDLDTVQHLAPDAPAEVYLDDETKVQASVVACNGLEITLACDKNLGTQVERAQLHSDLSMLMLRLIDRIEEKAQKGNPMGDRLLAGEFSGTLDPKPIPGDELTPSQKKAIQSALGRDSTFIWGPPGTGKTQTIGALVAELVKRGRRTLIVSHTNTAVDGALLRVADLVKREKPEMVEEGHILRVGQPRKKGLQERKCLHLAFQVERRVVHIQDELVRLRNELESPVECAKSLSKLVDVLEWLEFAVVEAVGLQERANVVRALRQKAHEAKAKWQEKGREGAALWRLAEDTQDLWVSARLLDDKDAELVTVRRQAVETGRVGERLIADIDAAQAALERASRGDGLRTALRSLEPAAQLEERLRVCEKKIAEREEQSRRLDASLEEASRTLQESRATGAWLRAFKRLPKPEDGEKAVAGIMTECVANANTLGALKTHWKELQRDVARRGELESELQDYRGVLSARDARQILDDLRQEVRSATLALGELKARAVQLARETQETRSQLASFQQEHGRSLEEVHRHADRLRQEVEALRCASAEAVRQLTFAESGWREDVREKGVLLVEWGLLPSATGTPEDVAEAVCGAIERKRREMALESLANRREDLATVNGSIAEIQDEIDCLEAQLRNVEESVIAEAAVVGATLTGAYLRDAIQRHRFDTVILDEASMAPIPAVWAVAGLAQASVVVVGDFLQLPPIVKSEEELAEKWLGRDVFEEAGVYGIEPIRALKDHLMILEEQFRMDPAISAVPRELIYNGLIRDGDKNPEKCAEEQAALDAWFDASLEPSSPLVLIDTSRLGAWVTTCVKGGGASRFNLLSASLCCRLLARGLRNERSEPEETDEKRCLMVAPYRPQARLMEVMLRERGLEAEALAGTAHSFQGGEAEIVVLDLVNDEPHRRVGLFIPDLDETNKRLLNVALTRAKRRLFVVGDFDYMRRTGRRSFLGGTLIPFLTESYQLVDACDLLREPFECLSVATHVGAGPILKTIGKDAESSQRLVVYSPRIDAFGAEDFLSALAGASLESQTILITKPTGDYLIREQAAHEGLVEDLRQRGLTVLFKKAMCEQMVVLDEAVWLLSGSLLDSADSELSAERLSGRKTVDEVVGLFAVDKIVGAFRNGPAACPICGRSMELREGADGPFYWSCPEAGCYTRNADGPELQDGRLVCKHGCGLVEFGWTGTGRAVWRCPGNARHVTYVACSHLRLPRMKELIPKKDLSKVEGLVCNKEIPKLRERSKPPKPKAPTDLRSWFKESPEDAAMEAIRRIVKTEGRLHRSMLLDKGVRTLTNGAAVRTTKSVLNRALSALVKAGEVRVEDDWTWVCPP